MMPDIFDRLNLPDKIRPITRDQGEFIYRFLKEKGLKNTLEVGLCYGCSTAYIISATRSKHIAIDPYQEESWKNVGLENTEKLGLKEFLRFENDFSYNALPKLLKEGIKIDFAFIDGMHLFDYAMVDFFYIDLLLNINGYVLIDDTFMRPVQLVVEWITKNKTNYKKIHVPAENLALFQKLNREDRKLDHFEEFYIPKITSDK